LAEGGAPLGWAELRIVSASDSSSIESLEKRLAQVGEIVVQEETLEPEKPTPAARIESNAPATPATDADLEALRTKFAKPKVDTKKDLPKRDAGAKAKRALDEIHKRTREHK
jgi:hypothetical protein